MLPINFLTRNEILRGKGNAWSRIQNSKGAGRKNLSKSVIAGQGIRTAQTCAKCNKPTKFPGQDNESVINR